MISFRPPPILPAGTCFPPTVNRLSIQSQLAPRCPQDRQCPQRENSSKQDAMALIPSDNSGTPLRRFSQFRGGGLSPWDSQLPPRRSPPASVGRSPSPSSNCGCPGAPNMSPDVRGGPPAVRIPTPPILSAIPANKGGEGQLRVILLCGVSNLPPATGQGHRRPSLGGYQAGVRAETPPPPDTTGRRGEREPPCCSDQGKASAAPSTPRDAKQRLEETGSANPGREGEKRSCDINPVATLVKQEFLIDTFSIAPDIPTNLEITNKVVATPAPSRMGVDVERDGGVRVHRRGGP